MGKGIVRGIGRPGVLVLLGSGTLALWLTACGVGSFDAGGAVAGRNTMPGTVETVGRPVATPPLDHDVPAVIETATFALG